MNTQKPEVTITRTLDAAPETVWRAWTEPEHLAQWLPSTPVESITWDVREGGKYQYTMVNHETGQDIVTGGTFLEVSPLTKLVFTWGNPGDPDAPVVTVSFTESGDTTEMAFHLVGFEGHPGDGFVYDGWSTTLDDLAGLVAA